MTRPWQPQAQSHTASRLSIILLGLIILWSVGHTIIWLWIDTRPPRWDESWYLTVSLRCARALSSEGIVAFLKAFLFTDPQRPPLIPLLAIPFYWIFGEGPDIALAVNLLAYVVLLLAVYGLGRRLVSAQVGVLSAFLTAMSPGVFWLSRVFLYDFVNAALVACTLYCLARTERFTNPRASLLLGFVWGLGMMSRSFFPIFVLGPLGVSVYTAWRAARLGDSGAQPHSVNWKTNFARAALVALLVIAPWYGYNIAPLAYRSLSAAYGAEAVGYGPSDPLTVSALVTYFINFIRYQSSLLGLGLFVIALGVLWLRRTELHSGEASALSPFQRVCFLLAAILIPYGFFCQLPSQDYKNVVPLLPLMAVVSAWGLSLLRSVFWRMLLVGGGGALALVQFWLGTYGVAAFPEEIAIPLRPHLPSLVVLRQAPMDNHSFHFLPRTENWHVTEVLSRITEPDLSPGGTRGSPRAAVVAMVPDHHVYNVATFTYEATLRHFPFTVLRAGHPMSPDKDYRTVFWESDFVVAKSDKPGLDWLNVYNTAALEFLRSPQAGFVEVSPRFQLPDGSAAILYAAQRHLAIGESPEIQHRMTVRFGEVVEFLGYTIEPKEQVSKGYAFLLHYYWKALRPLERDYRVAVQVMKDQQSAPLVVWDHFPARGRYPTSLWQPGTVIHDQGVYFLPSDTPAGSYTLRLGLFHPASGERLPIVSADAGIALDEGNSRAAIGEIPMPPQKLLKNSLITLRQAQGGRRKVQNSCGFPVRAEPVEARFRLWEQPQGNLSTASQSPAS
jgi:4-amino-4-deoxy-L-arabinose transferase-like glycosyltransferase